MSHKIHINPETGRIAQCNASVQCRFSVDGQEPKHYNTLQEAREALESMYADKTLTTIQKRTVITPATLKEREDSRDLKIREAIKKSRQENAALSAERNIVLEDIINARKEGKKEKFDQIIRDMAENGKYSNTVFYHGGRELRDEKPDLLKKVSEEREKYERIAKEKEEKIRQQRREKERLYKLETGKKDREDTISNLESLTEQEEVLKDDKRKVREYVAILEKKSYAATAIERDSSKIRDNSTKEDRHSAQLNVEDAEMFERDTFQDEYKKLLEIRADLRKKLKRNPLEGVNRLAARNRGVLTKKEGEIREINDRIGVIVNHSYRWRVGRKGKQQWKEFQSSIEHLLDDDEK